MNNTVITLIVTNVCTLLGLLITARTQFLVNREKNNGESSMQERQAAIQRAVVEEQEHSSLQDQIVKLRGDLAEANAHIKRLESDLEQEKRNRALLEAQVSAVTLPDIADTLWLRDGPSGKFLTIGPIFAAQLATAGISESQVIGKTPSEVVTEHEGVFDNDFAKMIADLDIETSRHGVGVVMSRRLTIDGDEISLIVKTRQIHQRGYQYTCRGFLFNHKRIIMEA